MLSTEHYDETKNQFGFVNSFTITQNEVLRELEKVTGEKFEITNVIGEEVGKIGLEKLKTGKMESIGGGEYAVGTFEVVGAALYGYGGANNYSKTKGIWNENLGLPVESLEETVGRVVKELL